MWILIDSEELRTQGMPSPNKLHHLRRPRRDTVSFRNAVVTPSEVERLGWGVGLIGFGRLGCGVDSVQCLLVSRIEPSHGGVHYGITELDCAVAVS
jgi:hypothetical protein